MTTKYPNHELSPMKCPVTLSDVDLFAPGAQEHWYEAYAILHNEAPVHRLPGEGYEAGTDGFVLTKYEDIQMVVQDPERFPPTTQLLVKNLVESETPPDQIPHLNTMVLSMTTLRPNLELWRSHRQELTDPWVGPGAGRHRDMIRAHANALIDKWIDRDEVEFISEFARPLPQRVLASVLGFPLDDLPRLEAWGNAQVTPFVYGQGPRNRLTEQQLDKQFKVLDEFKAYVAEQIAEKRRNPAEDMITFLTDVTYKALGRKLTDMEINGVVYAMVIGGLETTQYALEEEAQLLCEREGLWETLKADRSKLRNFVEESLRLRSPTQGLSTRTTSRDEVFQGVNVPKGSLLHLRWAAANLDEAEFECPHEVMLDRRAPSRHLAFSAGVRSCPGNNISRVEQRIAWDCLLDRLDHIEYAPGNTFLHQPGIMLGTLELKLRFTRPAAPQAVEPPAS